MIFIKRKRYKITFEKEMLNATYRKWEEVSDAYLLKTLLALQDEYDFEIVSFKLKECPRENHIVIKCNKEDIQNIVINYCANLSNKITNISWK